jgi:hypothetical protein
MLNFKQTNTVFRKTRVFQCFKTASCFLQQSDFYAILCKNFNN